MAPGWVLTAAHCSRKKLFVILKEYDLSVYEGDEIRVRVCMLYVVYNMYTMNDTIYLFIKAIGSDYGYVCCIYMYTLYNLYNIHAIINDISI